MLLSDLIGKLPAALRNQAIRALYLSKGKRLQEVMSFGDGRFFLFKVDGCYVPSEGVSWYLDFDQYRAMFDSSAGWAYQPKEGDAVVDIGAGIGEQALVLSRLVGPTGKVVCVEANPEAFE